uniref:Chromo domain-containing protein n=1 Tax=Micrurus lemniscatus lemniscatus TaxID=129467 RepID=A0A2D4J920_MICLE
MGPFLIVKVINPVTVQLRLPCLLGKVHPAFHSSLLKPAVILPTKAGGPEAPKPIVVQGETHYEVKKGIDSHLHWGNLQYLVHWKGYCLSEATGVKRWDVKADRLIKHFHDIPSKKPHTATCRGREVEVGTN